MKTGIAGCPTDDFMNAKRYFHEQVDGKTYSTVIKEYVKTLPKEEQTAILNNPEWKFTNYSHIPASIYWSKTLLMDFPQNWEGERCIQQYITSLIKSGTVVKEDTKEKEVSSISPAKRVQNKIDVTVFAQYDEMIDDWIRGEKTEFDLYESIQKNEIKGPVAFSYIKSVIQRELDDLRGVQNKTDEQLVEAYSHLQKRELTRRIGILEKMIASLDSAKTVLKARRVVKTKTKSADKLIASLKFKKEDGEYKIASINPTTIVGSSRLYVFNTKTRYVAEYVSDSSKGLEVSGTTIKNYVPEKSRWTKLRNPEAFLSFLLKKSVTQIAKEWEKLTTKTEFNITGRIGQDHILLRVV